MQKIPWSWSSDEEHKLLTREWLVTNGLGGYAGGSLSGAVTRRYHGLLVAALPAPLGRVVMLNHVAEEVRLPGGRIVMLGGEERPGGVIELPGARVLKEFRLEWGLPIWRYEIDDVVLERHVYMPHRQNTTYLVWRLLSAKAPIRLRLRPSMNFRPHERPVHTPPGDYRVTGAGNRYEIAGPDSIPPLRCRIHGESAAFVLDGGRSREYWYRIEAARGYESLGTLWSPGYLRADLQPGAETTIIVSTEPWDIVDALAPKDALVAELDRRRCLVESADPATREGIGSELVLAADQFIAIPAARVADAARARASGDEACTVIAGYHWFTDWGRDTMISLEGLTLCTGRRLEAGRILRTFAQAVRDGLIPNLYPEHNTEGLYHTADATLWFFHAISRYLAVTGDRATLQALLPKLVEIVDRHVAGTKFGIRVDPEDGLLRQGAEGYALTWMDAKVGDWVVTPRRGKAVEINALWYNALRLLQAWLAEEGQGDRSAEIARAAERAKRSFNERFWCAERGWLYDILDGEKGNDASLRPNQLFAISLPHPVLDESRWKRVFDVCREQLYTPVGLRSLAPGERDYRRTYDGDLRSRDAAYHQGTVWSWLIGPYVDAYLRLHPTDKSGARKLLDGFAAHLGEACIGQVSEVFDAEAPYNPRGCVAQAWGVAEALRCLVKTA